MQVKWGLRMFLKDLLIVVAAFLISLHFYLAFINDPYIQKIFFN